MKNKWNNLLGFDGIENGGVSFDVDDLDVTVTLDQTKADCKCAFYPYQIGSFIRNQFHLLQKSW